MTNLLAALIMVESSGNPHPPVGRNGELGPLQISAVVVADVNRIYGTHYRHEDALELPQAVAICIRYLDHWSARKYLGRDVTDQDRARIWNGGPDGWRQPGTVKYWHKVKRILNRRKKTNEHSNRNNHTGRRHQS